MAEKWVSVAELAKLALVPESTTRRYLSRYDQFFRYDERARGKRYHPESVAVISLIQTMYGEGMEAEEIEQALAKQFPINVVTDHSLTTTDHPPAPMVATRSDLEAVLSELLTVREELASLRQENRELHKELDNRMDERDRRLMEAMQQKIEARKEIAAAAEEVKPRKWYYFWRL